MAARRTTLSPTIPTPGRHARSPPDRTLAGPASVLIPAGGEDYYSGSAVGGGRRYVGAICNLTGEPRIVGSDTVSNFRRSGMSWMLTPVT